MSVKPARKPKINKRAFMLGRKQSWGKIFMYTRSCIHNQFIKLIQGLNSGKLTRSWPFHLQSYAMQFPLRCITYRKFKDFMAPKICVFWNA